MGKGLTRPEEVQMKAHYKSTPKLLWHSVLPRNCARAWCGLRGWTCCICWVAILSHWCGFCLLKNCGGTHSCNSCLNTRKETVVIVMQYSCKPHVDQNWEFLLKKNTHNVVGLHWVSVTVVLEYIFALLMMVYLGMLALKRIWNIAQVSMCIYMVGR